MPFCGQSKAILRPGDLRGMIKSCLPPRVVKPNVSLVSVSTGPQRSEYGEANQAEAIQNRRPLVSGAPVAANVPEHFSPPPPSVY